MRKGRAVETGRRVGMAENERGEGRGEKRKEGKKGREEGKGLLPR